MPAASHACGRDLAIFAGKLVSDLKAEHIAIEGDRSLKVRDDESRRCFGGKRSPFRAIERLRDSPMEVCRASVLIGNRNGVSVGVNGWESELHSPATFGSSPAGVAPQIRESQWR